MALLFRYVVVGGRKKIKLIYLNRVQYIKKTEIHDLKKTTNSGRLSEARAHSFLYQLFEMYLIAFFSK